MKKEIQMIINKRYVIEVEEEGTFTGEFRGQYGDDLLFWIDGNSAASTFYYREVKVTKTVK